MGRSAANGSISARTIAESDVELHTKPQPQNPKQPQNSDPYARLVDDTAGSSISTTRQLGDPGVATDIARALKDAALSPTATDIDLQKFLNFVFEPTNSKPLSSKFCPGSGVAGSFIAFLADKHNGKRAMKAAFDDVIDLTEEESCTFVSKLAQIIRPYIDNEQLGEYATLFARLGNIALLKIAVAEWGLNIADRNLKYGWMQPGGLACCAVHSGRAAVLKYMIENGVDLSQQYGTDEDKRRVPNLLFFAFHNPSAEVANLLVQQGVDAFEVCTEWNSRLFGQVPIVGLVQHIPSAAIKALLTKAHAKADGHTDSLWKYNFEGTLIRNIEGPLQFHYPFGATGQKYALLDIIVKSGNKEILRTPLIQKVMFTQWRVYGKRLFYLDLITYLCFVLSFSMCMLFWPRDPEYCRLGKNAGGVILWVLTGIGFVARLHNEIPEMLVGVGEYLSSIWNVLDIIQLSTVAVLMIKKAASETCHDKIDAVFTALCIMLMFYKAQEFAGVPRSSGPFVMMVKGMMGDVAKFMSFFALFYCGFVIAFSVLFQFSETANEPASELKIPRPDSGSEDDEILHSWMIPETVLLWGLFGDFEYAKFRQLDNGLLQYTAKFLFFLFMTLSNVMLLNLLIAMMSNTYQGVADNTDINWWLMRADTLMRMSKHASQEQQQRFIHTLNTLQSTNVMEDEVSVDPPDNMQEMIEVVNNQLEMIQLNVTGLGAKLEAQVQRDAELNARLDQIQRSLELLLAEPPKKRKAALSFKM